MFGKKKEPEEPKIAWGMRCIDCGKAMFFTSKQPRPGIPFNSESVYVRAGFPKPVNGHGVTCQFCDAHWMKIKFVPAQIARFNEATGEEITH